MAKSEAPLVLDLNNQSVDPLAEKSKGKSDKKRTYALRRDARRPTEFYTVWNKKILTCYDNFNNVVTQYSPNELLGYRPVDANGAPGAYVFLTAKSIGKRVEKLASGFIELGLKAGSHVGIYSKNRLEWSLAEFACYQQSLINVALYDTFGPENLVYVVNHAELSIIVASLDRVENMIKHIKDCPKLKILVSMDELSEDTKNNLKKDLVAQVGKEEAKGIKILSLSEVEELGKKTEHEPVPPAAEDLAFLMYTSGTTGPPKGVMISHSNMIASITALMERVGGVTANDCYLSYLPLAHILERVAFHTVLSRGTKIGYFSGDLRAIAPDIQALRPTIMCGVPRVFEKIYSGLQAKVGPTGLKRKLFDAGYKSKSQLMAKGQDSWFWNMLIFNKPKRKFGGRLRMLISGGAPLAPTTQEFLKIVFGCDVLQGYGLTETTATAAITYAEDPAVGEVGPPLGCNEIRLESVPDMNYSATEDPPRGEVWVRGPNITRGYYKDEEKTKEDFDEDGWFRTGDIGEFTARGTLRIIDRKKNIFKLSQGEYVAPEFLENIYLKSPYVLQIWVHGESLENALVAVAVADPEAILGLAQQAQIQETDLKELLKNKDIIALVLKSFEDLRIAQKRPTYEQIRLVHLVDYEFSVDNDLTTPTLKLKRPNLKKQFAEEIQQMYEDCRDQPYLADAAPVLRSGKSKRGLTVDDSVKKGSSKENVDDAPKRGHSKGKVDDSPRKAGSKQKVDDSPRKAGSKQKVDDSPRKGASKQKVDDTPKKGSSKQKVDDTPKKGASKEKVDDAPKKGASKEKVDDAPKKGASKEKVDDAPKKGASKDKVVEESESDDTPKKADSKTKVDDTPKKTDSKPKADDTPKKTDSKPKADDTPKKADSKAKVADKESDSEASVEEAKPAAKKEAKDNSGSDDEESTAESS